MKKLIRPAALLLILTLLAGALSGCRLGEQKRLRERAKAHLTRLDNHKDVSDTFMLSEEKVKYSDRSASVPFQASSKTYGESFTVWVSRLDDTVTDDYYGLYLRDEAEKKTGAVLKEALGEGTPETRASFMKIGSPVLSLHAAGSLEELLKISRETLKMNNVMEIRLKLAGGANPDEAAVDKALIALREKGYYCRFYPYVSEAVWFEILPDGFWKNVQSGADNGAYLNRTEYTPAAGN